MTESPIDRAQALQADDGSYPYGYGEDREKGASPLPLQGAEGVLDVEEETAAHELSFRLTVALWR